MNAIESNLLIQADRMSESMLVGMQDWELAYLRVAMLHKVEETLEQSLIGSDAVQEERAGACVDRDVQGVGITEGSR